MIIGTWSCEKTGFFHEIYIIIVIFTRVNPMRKTLLVLPGYCVGLGGLVLITYRTLLALGTESKSVTIQVNRFGEQYLDVMCLVFLWGVCMLGMLSLSSVLKKETIGKEFARDTNGGNVGTKPGVSYNVSSDFLHGSSGVVAGVLGESLSKTSSGFFRLDDDETDGGFSYSVCVVQEATEE